MSEKNSHARDGLKGSDLPTIFAFAFYQCPEDDKTLADDSFRRKCPCCKRLFDVRSISEYFRISFLECKSGARAFPCPQCVASISKLGRLEFRKRGEKALKNIENSENPNGWAVTTEIAVLSHGGDEVAAIVYGCLLSEKTINAYDRGEIDLALLVLGMPGVRHV